LLWISWFFDRGRASLTADLPLHSTGHPIADSEQGKVDAVIFLQLGIVPG
jgi:hypothetical protein